MHMCAIMHMLICHMFACAFTFVHAHTHSCSHAFVLTPACSNVRAHMFTHACSHIHTYMFTHACSHIHTCSHMRIYTYILTHSCSHLNTVSIDQPRKEEVKALQMDELDKVIGEASSSESSASESSESSSSDSSSSETSSSASSTPPRKCVAFWVYQMGVLLFIMSGVCIQTPVLKRKLLHIWSPLLTCTLMEAHCKQMPCLF